MKRRWTKAEEFRLLELAERKDRHEIAAELGLHWKTVANRLAVLKARPKSDLLSLRECIRRTGYLKHQLHRAREGLNQRWRRRSFRGQSYGITEAQLDALCEYLRNEG